MAVLEVQCNNQILEWVKDPAEIYAGNINIDSISFKFCELWDGYTKTAVFYRNEKEVYHILLDDTNTCLIPSEVTGTSGIVYIGVFGIKGDCRRTTAVKSWYLKAGVLTEGNPSEPTPDVYQQILNSVKAPHIGDNGNWYEWDSEMEAFVDTGVKAYGEDGYTPQRGTDYWTDADKAEIKEEVEPFGITVDIEVTDSGYEAKNTSATFEEVLSAHKQGKFIFIRGNSEGSAMLGQLVYVDETTLIFTNVHSSGLLSHMIYNPDNSWTLGNLRLCSTTTLDDYYTVQQTDELLRNKADTTYVDEQIGDIETALDNIIAIQNQLMGVSE